MTITQNKMEPASTVTTGIMDASGDLERGVSGLSVDTRKPVSNLVLETEKATSSPDTISEDVDTRTYSSEAVSPDDLPSHPRHHAEETAALARSPVPSTPSASVLEYMFSSNRKKQSERSMDEAKLMKVAVLEQTAHYLATHPSDCIQRRKKARLNQLNDNAKLLAENVFQSHQPIAVLLTSTRWVLIALLLAIIPQLIDTAFVLKNVLTSFSPNKFAHFRFVQLTQTGKPSAESSLSPLDFHILFNGCINDVGNVTLERDGGALTKSFPAPVRINGWLVKIPTQGDGGGEGEAGGAGRVLFRVEGSRDGVEWGGVASSRWWHGARLGLKLAEGALEAGGAERIAEFDMRPPPGLVLFRVQGPALKLALYLVAVGLVVRGRAVGAGRVLVWSLGAEAALALASAALLVDAQHTQAALLPLASGGYLLGAFAVLRWREQWLVEVALLAGVLPAAALLEELVVHGEGLGAALAEVPYAYVVLVLLGCRGLAHKRHLLAMARHNIAADTARYKAAWEAYLGRADAREAGALRDLNRVLKALKSDLGGSRPCHLLADDARPSPILLPAVTPLAAFTPFSTRGLASPRLALHTPSAPRAGAGGMRGGLKKSLFRRLDPSAADGESGVQAAEDLDQVLVQGRGLQPFFIHKVWQWAQASAAMLPVLPEGGAREAGAGRAGAQGEGRRRWSVEMGRRRSSEAGEASRGAGQRAVVYVPAESIGDKAGVAWAELKGADRAIDKVRRVYGDKASRLVDVVRERLVFRSAREMLGCLQTVVSDPHAVIRGVKNGMRQSYNADWSAGFRAVVLSLSLSTPETCALSLSLHVAELQLVLLPLAQLQLQSNHRAYLIFRDTRALKANSPFRTLLAGATPPPPALDHTPEPLPAAHPPPGEPAAGGRCAGEGEGEGGEEKGRSRWRLAGFGSARKLVGGRVRRDSIESTLGGALSPAALSPAALRRMLFSHRRPAPLALDPASASAPRRHSASLSARRRSSLLDPPAALPRHSSSLSRRPSVLALDDAPPLRGRQSSSASTYEHALWRHSSSSSLDFPLYRSAASSRPDLRPPEDLPSRCLPLAELPLPETATVSGVAFGADPAEDSQGESGKEEPAEEEPAIEAAEESEEEEEHEDAMEEEEDGEEEEEEEEPIRALSPLAPSSRSSTSEEAAQGEAGAEGEGDGEGEVSVSGVHLRLSPAVSFSTATATDPEPLPTTPHGGEGGAGGGGRSVGREASTLRQRLCSPGQPVRMSPSLAGTEAVALCTGSALTPVRGGEGNRGSRVGWEAGAAGEGRESGAGEKGEKGPRKVSISRRRGRRSLPGLTLTRRAAAVVEAVAGAEESFEDGLEEVFRRAVRSKGGSLDGRVRRSAAAALQGASLTSAMFTSTPLSSTVGFRRVQALLLAAALLLFLAAVLPLRHLGQQGFQLVEALRLEALPAPGEDPPSVAGVAALDLLRDGCESGALFNGSRAVRGRVLETQWAPAVRANGWFFRVEEGPRPRSPAPARFAAWWRPRGEEWQCVLPGVRGEEGAGECEALLEEVSEWQEGGGGAGGERVVRVDRRPTVAGVVWVAVPVLKGLGLAAAAALGMLHLNQRAVWALASAHWATAAVLALAGVALGGGGEGRELWGWWAGHSVLQVGFGCGLVVGQRRMVAMQAAQAAANMAMTARYLRGAEAGWVGLGLLGEAAVLCGCVVVAGLRWAILRSSARLIGHDKARYDALWEELRAEPAADAALDSLRAAVAAFNVRAAEAPRQRAPVERGGAGGGWDSSRLLRPRSSGAGGVVAGGKQGQGGQGAGVGVGRRGSGQEVIAPFALAPAGQGGEGAGRGGSGGSGWGRGEGEREEGAGQRESQTVVLVRSLDQLFAQAGVMHHVFKDKVKAWALASRGMVRSQKGGYVQWSEVAGGAEAGQCQWAGVKRCERAMEKTLRSYGGDASRLVDVCRQALVFARIEDMEACLAAVRADREVEVLRVKNRLDTAFDSSLSAGYRDVALNLRVLSPLTSSLALSFHVCELQLILYQFALLKSSEGHKRYVEFRNKRAE